MNPGMPALASVPNIIVFPEAVAVKIRASLSLLSVWEALQVGRKTRPALRRSRRRSKIAWLITVITRSSFEVEDGVFELEKPAARRFYLLVVRPSMRP
jgi:hypothetical protein